MEKWFSIPLIKWYNKNKRDLPWRKETSAYKIWLSEIILQQTQVVQGLPYYLKFLHRFDNVNKLAKASEDEILKLWQGLGYYSRARNMHHTAKIISEKYKGKFPETFEEIKSLKGVGDYTAAAITSFAFNKPHAVVDGNVYRFIGRLFGIKLSVQSAEGKTFYKKLAQKLLDKKNPALHNQAIMEFGSQYCKAANPDCLNCIFISKCVAFKNKVVTAFPIKEKKQKIRKRFFNYLVLADKKNNILINKRAGKDIWQGLCEFTLIESEKNISLQKLLERKDVKIFVKNNFQIIHSSKTYKHILSHQHIFAKFYIIKVNYLWKKNLFFTQPENIHAPAYPRLIEKFLKDCNVKDLL